MRPSPFVSRSHFTTPNVPALAARLNFSSACTRRTCVSSLPVLLSSSMSSWPARLYPCNSETNIRPRSSQHTPDGDAMSGSLTTISMRKPGGSLNAAALCSGAKGLGASVGFGICAKAGLVVSSMSHASPVDSRMTRYGVGECIEISLCEVKTANISSNLALYAPEYRAKVTNESISTKALNQ